MDTLIAPVGERIELRTVKKVNLRSEGSTKASIQALLEPDVIVWKDSEDGDFLGVWVHGFVHKSFLKEIE